MEEIKTDLKKLILSHQSLSQLRKPRQQYIANQLVTVFCKGKNLKTVLYTTCASTSRSVARTPETFTLYIFLTILKNTFRKHLTSLEQ